MSADGATLAPGYIAHWVVKTARMQEMIELEFQVENFPTADETAHYFGTPAFADNPVGVTFDPDCLLGQLRSGVARDELVKQGAGTPHGQKPRANRRAVTWRSL